MISALLEDTSIENFEEALRSLEKRASSIIILSCHNDFSQQALNPILKQTSVPLIGGIFPSIIYQNKHYMQGTILLGIDTPLDVTILKDIHQKNDYEKVIEEQTTLIKDDTQTMFLFFDGLSTNINKIVQALFNNFGLSINYIGGAAARLEGIKPIASPVLFSNEGLLQHAALLASTPSQSTIGVQHGLEPIENDNYQVTKSEGNILYEIDYQPAFQLYKKLIESHLNENFEKFDEEDFLKRAITYPLGIIRLSGESIVRTALAVQEDNSLICTGDISENALIQILHAKNENLIKAASLASQVSRNSRYHTNFNLYFTCLARILILGEEFQQEIDTVYQEGTLLVGAVSMGEIANNKDHYLELYNATTVVANIDDTSG